MATSLPQMAPLACVFGDCLSLGHLHSVPCKVLLTRTDYLVIVLSCTILVSQFWKSTKKEMQFLGVLLMLLLPPILGKTEFTQRWEFMTVEGLDNHLILLTSHNYL